MDADEILDLLRDNPPQELEDPELEELYDRCLTEFELYCTYDMHEQDKADYELELAQEYAREFWMVTGLNKETKE